MATLIDQKPPATLSSMRLSQLVTKIASHVVLIFFTLVIIYPVLWVVMTSFKTSGEMNTNILGLPQNPSMTNLVNAWNKAEMGRALTNSLVVSLSIVAFVVILASVAAFALARFKFRGATIIFLLFVFTMQAPAPMIALYVMAVKLHLTNTYWGLILPSVAGGLPLAIFIFRAFFLTIPAEIMDAAKVDGCNDFDMFLRVVMPISGPAVATVAILQFVGAWNEYTLPLIMIRVPELRTLPLTIQVFFNQWGQVTWPEVFSALTIGTIPMVILYIIMQQQFIQGLTSGAVKG